MPRLGELHVVMCALRAFGSSIEHSGIYDVWVEADVYSSDTSRQILNCTHYNGSLGAHIYSNMTLYELAIEQFFKDKHDLAEDCKEATSKVERACKDSNKTTRPASVKLANSNLLRKLAEKDFQKRLGDWETQKNENAMFRSMKTILFFVAASRNGNIDLHLQAGEALSKLFLAMDRLKYKRLWPRYLADMNLLKNNRQDTWQELEQDNISVTKSSIPFVSIGPDHACEQLNRTMKVHAGLTGISNNPNARQRFFLATPKLSCLVRDFESVNFFNKPSCRPP